jgi:preprotein translocase subunit SecA
MLTWTAKKLFGTSNERAMRRLRPLVTRVNALEADLQKLSDLELQAKTPEFKQRLANGESLDSMLCEAFAVCREASRRVLKMRHFDVQLMGGITLHRGRIAEMRTGEGKTLVATLPVYLNALTGKGVHVVTVNDYLARRDAEVMGRLYHFLGLSIGTIVNGQSDAEKRQSYRSDICYGQNNEFGFDYLRDNMKFSAFDYVQRPLHYAIVDEVDSILIDEARTPLIISGPGEAAGDKYRALNAVVSRLRRDEHFTVDEKAHSAHLTDEGVEAVERMSGISNLYDPRHIGPLHIVNQLLRAYTLYKRDQQYLVSPEDKVLIIDELTGRVLDGRRWSDGLHQAVEAKENVPIQEESRTVATITFQNLFRLYEKLAGMTGTAETEAQEFSSTYTLDVNTVPTHRDMIRVDGQDVVYKTEREKFSAVIREIMRAHEQGRPVLVGTTSVEKSAALSRILEKKGIDHNVLNAKHHENEAYVVAQAGRKGAITVSTNMAGRGTDIMLGGNPEMLARWELVRAGTPIELGTEGYKALVKQYENTCGAEHDEVVALGGLHIVGTERHESRRIDNQLRGRAGRQGDPGSSRFFLSLEDDLMRIFAGDKVKSLMDRMGMPDDEPIEHPWVSRSIENAQRKVESRNFDIRKHLLEYDDVMNSQRRTVYALRQQLLEGRYSAEANTANDTTEPTRAVAVDDGIRKHVAGLVAQLIGLFASPPVLSRDPSGALVSPTREQLARVESLSEPEQLDREIYQLWGVRSGLVTLSAPPLALYDELCERIARSLTDQRERALDLMDRVVAAIVEECCPEARPPEDWDWAGVFRGFREHFQRELPPEAEQLGERNRLVRFVYQQAEKAFEARERELGLDLNLRVFRHVYLEAIDQSWIDHLTNMEHLRDGIGLRGYGQKDPKNEYKKEGYELFVNMMAKISSTVLTKFFTAAIQRQPEIEPAAGDAEGQLDLDDQTPARPDELLAQLQAIQATGGALSDPQSALEQQSLPQPQSEPRLISPEMPCPCGSGNAFNACHGRVDDDLPHVDGERADNASAPASLVAE